MSLKAITKPCVICGTAFVPTKDRLRCCSQECAREFQSRRAASKRITLICVVCGEPFEVIPARMKKAIPKYCSMKCYGAAERGKPRPTRRLSRITLTCEHCGAAYERLPSQLRKQRRTGQYCSIECSNAAQSARKKKRRDALLTRAWRDFVLERDGHRCQSCGNTDQLHAHHIRPWATYPAGRFDPANGVTLCKTCHMNLHNHSEPAQLKFSV